MARPQAWDEASDGGLDELASRIADDFARSHRQAQMSSPSGDGGDSRAIMERWLQEELDTEQDEGAQGAKELSTPKPAEQPSLGARPAHSEEDVLATPAQSNHLRMPSSLSELESPLPL